MSAAIKVHRCDRGDLPQGVDHTVTDHPAKVDHRTPRPGSISKKRRNMHGHDTPGASAGFGLPPRGAAIAGARYG
jgi:hypothetical protein